MKTNNNSSPTMKRWTALVTITGPGFVLSREVRALGPTRSDAMSALERDHTRQHLTILIGDLKEDKQQELPLDAE